jgi:Sigma-70 region 2
MRSDGPALEGSIALSPGKEVKSTAVENARALIDAAKLRSQKDAERRSRDRDRDMGLISQIRHGDQRAFAQLVEHHQHRLFAVAVGMMKDRDEAMDVVQDAFIRAYKKLPGLRAMRPSRRGCTASW